MLYFWNRDSVSLEAHWEKQVSLSFRWTIYRFCGDAILNGFSLIFCSPFTFWLVRFFYRYQKQNSFTYSRVNPCLLSRRMAVGFPWIVEFVGEGGSFRGFVSQSYARCRRRYHFSGINNRTWSCPNYENCKPSLSLGFLSIYICCRKTPCETNVLEMWLLHGSRF